jgi:hypothetical protein
MAVVLDAGALIAVDRADARVLRYLDRVARGGNAVRTSSVVVAQVWRDGARQARLTLALRGVHEVPVDLGRSRSIGELLAAHGSHDVVDGAIVQLSADGDDVLTSDPADITSLAATAGRRIRVVPL